MGQLEKILTDRLTQQFTAEFKKNCVQPCDLQDRKDTWEVTQLVDQFLLQLHLWFTEFDLLDEETQQQAVNAIRLGGFRSQDIESFYAWKVAVTDSDNLAQAVRFCRAIEQIYVGKESYEPAQSS